WAADGEDPVADLGAVGVAELHGRQGLRCVDLDDGDVGLGIGADDLGEMPVVEGVIGVAVELDVDLVGFVDDVIVGNDVTARVDDEARAEGFALGVAGAVIATLAAEEAVEEVLHIARRLLIVIAAVWVGNLRAAAVASGRVGLLGQGDGVDVYDGRAD